MDLASYAAWLPTLAASLSLLQIPVMHSSRHALNWDAELRALSPLMQSIVRLFGAGITLCVSGLALVVLVSHGKLAASAVGVALGVFLALFWCCRALMQWTWLAPHWRARVPKLHRTLSLLYPAIAAMYSGFALHALFG